MQDKDFVKEMDLSINKVIKYKKPCVIALSGYAGSGKTEVARTLSKELGIFLLSNDYVRNYYYQFTNDYSENKRLEIESKVRKINNLRLRKLLKTRTSFVYDRDFSLKRDFDKFKILSKVLGMQLIKINVKADDSHNLEKIKDLVLDYDKIYPFVIGDNVEYQSPFDDVTYYQIKKRKPHTLPDEYYDYVIDNTSDEHFAELLKVLVKSLNEDYLKNKK